MNELALQLVNNNGIEKVLKVFEAVDDFLPQRRSTISRMYDEAKKLDGHKFRGNIAQIGGGVVSIGAIALGIGLAPVSFGVSLGVGIGVGGAGLATSFGTRGVLYKLSKDTKSIINDIVEADEKKCAKLRQEWNGLDSICKKLAKENPMTTWEKTVKLAFKLGQTMIDIILNIAFGRFAGLLGRKGEVIAKSLYKVYSNQHIQSQIVKPLKNGDFKSLFSNISQIAKTMVSVEGFFDNFFIYVEIIGEIAITATATAIGGFFVTVGGALAILALQEVITAISNIIQGSVAEASHEIRKKAGQLEEQSKELEEFHRDIKEWLNKMNRI